MLEIKHKNTGAVPHCVGADTLEGAIQSRANLQAADLSRARLRGAHLLNPDARHNKS